MEGGDGEQVDVRRDKWINKVPSYKPICPMEYTGHSLKVATLIDSNTRTWKEELISLLFSQEDARRVLGKEQLQRELRSPIWQMLWKAKLLPKVKIFIWRLLWGILPAKEAMTAQVVGVDCRCSVCGVENETGFCVFFDCVFSRAIWEEICARMQTFLDRWSSSDEFLLTFMIKSKQENQMDICLYALWLIWLNRNQCPHNAKCNNTIRVITNKVRGTLHRFNSEFRSMSRVDYLHILVKWTLECFKHNTCQT
ncbi:uncharacterized protein LOC111274571 [Durio zibethinus]|uniref:Uncharacterized protein LOC111274571 n=1 Tax=Durio zibethinus TaxID=66656 RepID=A0A6P5WGB8_DURZI|nr:uncharacterized protein LOC111274571 [Durio zibethinus]